MKLLSLVCLIACPPLLFAASSHSPSAYAGARAGEIKSLSADEIAGYMDGKGMGLAKAAELNGYPGPRHVLELADELGLSPEQRSATSKVFDAMQVRARELGQQLVSEERRLDQEFSTREITTERLEELTNRIGTLHAAIRKAHLQAHLQEAAILTAKQTTGYQQLRGYGAHHQPTPIDEE